MKTVRITVQKTGTYNNIPAYLRGNGVAQVRVTADIVTGRVEENLGEKIVTDLARLGLQAHLSDEFCHGDVVYLDPKLDGEMLLDYSPEVKAGYGTIQLTEENAPYIMFVCDENGDCEHNVSLHADGRYTLNGVPVIRLVESDTAAYEAPPTVEKTEIEKLKSEIAILTFQVNSLKASLEAIRNITNLHA